MGRIPDIDIEVPEEPEEQHPPEGFRDIGNAE
jgi:hypothetical protein